MAFTVYVSHSTSPWELAHVYALADEAARRGFGVDVPDRDWDPAGPLPQRIVLVLSHASVILFLATQSGNQVSWMNSEMAAAPRSAPVIALVEPGIEVQGIPRESVVSLDRGNIAESIEATLRRLQDLRFTRETTNLLAGFVVGALALLVLRAFTSGGRGQDG
ncbi:MAG: hypothetical protein Q8O40_11550 [Chloroflexota bacterium]|nr:hypothetical protein [Chloroflexota bacterium]